MPENHPVDLERTRWQLRKPMQIFRREFRTSPVNCGLGDRVEVIGGHEICCCLIVIPADGERTKLADFCGDLVGIRTVAHDVAETHHTIPAAFGSIESGIESSRVAVQIAKNESAHSE